jgi:hypothetical protein
MLSTGTGNDILNLGLITTRKVVEVEAPGVTGRCTIGLPDRACERLDYLILRGPFDLIGSDKTLKYLVDLQGTVKTRSAIAIDTLITLAEHYSSGFDGTKNNVCFAYFGLDAEGWSYTFEMTASDGFWKVEVPTPASVYYNRYSPRVDSLTLLVDSSSWTGIDYFVSLQLKSDGSTDRVPNLNLVFAPRVVTTLLDYFAPPPQRTLRPRIQWAQNWTGVPAPPIHVEAVNALPEQDNPPWGMHAYELAPDGWRDQYSVALYVDPIPGPQPTPTRTRSAVPARTDSPRATSKDTSDSGSSSSSILVPVVVVVIIVVAAVVVLVSCFVCRKKGGADDGLNDGE